MRRFAGRAWPERVWIFAGNPLIELDFQAVIRSVSGMQIAPASTPISHDMHLAVVAERDALRFRLAALEAAFEKLQFDLQRLLRQRFGMRTENIDQLHLFGADDVEFIEQTKEVPVAPPVKKAITRDRVILPADLPVEREEIDVPASEKIATDGAPLVRIGEEISIKLGYRPAAFFKRELVRPKYVDPRQPDIGVRIAPLPPQSLDGSLLDATLGAHLLVSKYGDHSPLNRLEQIYARSGTEVPRSTLCDWVIALTDRWLWPLVIAMKEHRIHSPDPILAPPLPTTAARCGQAR